MNNARITGLGCDQTHESSVFVDGVLTITIDSPVPPSTLSIVVQDNKGNETAVTVSGLTLR